MSMQLLGYSPEDKIDFCIAIELYPKYERQKKIDELYQYASDILSNALSIKNNTN